MANSMKVSVILCTYNRCESLANALASLDRSKVPESIQWEVLVVDNNSSDATRSVVEEFSRRDPARFCYLFEPKQGKSHALNAGIQAARGEILAFTDDDVTVEPTWLQNLASSLTKGDWVGAGGRTVPERTFLAPRWLAREDRYALGPLAMFDLGCEPSKLMEPPFGNNMAYRRAVFEKYGCFRTELGPRPGSEIRSEDTEFGQRLLSAGESLRYEPSAVVYHAVPASRLQKGYFLAWWFDKGRADFLEFGNPAETRWFVVGVPLYLFRRLAAWTLRWLVRVGPARRFYCRLQLNYLTGQVLEHFRRSHAPRQFPAPNGS